MSLPSVPNGSNTPNVNMLLYRQNSSDVNSSIYIYNYGTSESIIYNI